MFDSATKQAYEYRKPSNEEWDHIIHHHLRIEISTRDGAATISVVGECDEKCPTHVHSTKYCKRPPC